MGRTNTDFEGRALRLPASTSISRIRSSTRSISARAASDCPIATTTCKPDFRRAEGRIRELCREAADARRLAGPAGAPRRPSSRSRRRSPMPAGPRPQQRDPVAIYNPMTPGRAREVRARIRLDGLPAPRQASASVKRVIVAEKTAFPKLAAIYAQTPIETIRPGRRSTSPTTPRPISRSLSPTPISRCTTRRCSGQAEQAARWKRGVHAVSGGDFGVGDRFDTFGNLGWAVGQLYTRPIFPACGEGEDRGAGRQPEGRLSRAHREARLDEPGDQGGGAEKARRPTRSRSAIPIIRATIPRSSSATTTWSATCARGRRPTGHFYVGRLNGPVDRSDWGMTPQTNDAYNGSLQRHRVPRGHPAAADLRCECGRGDQLRRGRRRDRPRADPRLRRPGPQDRRRRRAARLVDAGRRAKRSRRAPRCSARNTRRSSRCPACM